MKLSSSKPVLYSSYVTNSGKLKSHLRPAAFCDTSFLLDYWNSIIHDPLLQINPNSLNDQTEQVFIEYLKADARTKKIYQIRRKFTDGNSRLNLVFTPACRLELEEVITALRFKKYGSEVVEGIQVSKKNGKEIGDILSRLKMDFHTKRRKRKKDLGEQGLDLLFHHFFYTTNRIEKDLKVYSRWIL